MHRSTYGRRVLILAAALLTAAAGGVSAAELIITGPRGAQVTVDGQAVGLLPLANSVVVEPGQHTLKATLRGMEDHELSVRIADPGQQVRVELRMRRLSRRDILLGALLLAGHGQRELGRDRLGWALTAVELGGLVAALYGEVVVQNSRDEYELAMASYNEALVPYEITYYRELAADKLDSAENAASLRDTGLAVAVGAVAVGLLDALLRFPSVEAGPGPAPLGLTSAPYAPPAQGVHLACTLNW
jgi:hypothetical protein